MLRNENVSYSDSIASARPRGRILTFAGGGWVLVLAGALILGVIAWRVKSWNDTRLMTEGIAPPAYQSNGFELKNSIVPLTHYVRVFKREGFQALNAAPAVPVTLEMLRNQSSRGKRLVRTDRVIGVELNGEARAYPIRILNWHEIANDVVGGVPLVVTFGAATDSAAVYRRDVDGKTLDFGHSGLTSNGNFLLFDRQSAWDQSSLWSQLQGRALTGPLRNRRLELLPCALVTLEAWLTAHPASTVVLGDPALERKHYSSTAYAHQYANKSIPIVPTYRVPAESRIQEFDQVLVVDSQPLLYADLAALVAANPAADGWSTQKIGAQQFEVQYTPAQTPIDPPTARVLRREGDRLVPVPVIYSRYYAWYAANEALQASP
ncbi:MAG: DUF3179 domain-containing (seleno)protein [Planctomycetota bacterium]